MSVIAATRSIGSHALLGVVQVAAAGVFSRLHGGASVQLRFRSEMADVFTDLAVDLGLRDAERRADTPRMTHVLLTALCSPPPTVFRSTSTPSGHGTRDGTNAASIVGDSDATLGVGRDAMPGLESR